MASMEKSVFSRKIYQDINNWSVFLGKIYEYLGISFNKGRYQVLTFTCLKWSLVPPDFKECCIRYSSKFKKKN